MNKEHSDRYYFVLMNDGMELAFNKDGEWTSIWSKYGTVPETVLRSAGITDIDWRTGSVYKMIRESKYSGINVYLIRNSLKYVRTYNSNGGFIREELLTDTAD